MVYYPRNKQGLLAVAAAILSGCASWTGTGTTGITRGMTKEQVLEKLSGKYEIVGQGENFITAYWTEGPYTIKAFIFKNDRLVKVQDNTK